MEQSPVALFQILYQNETLFRLEDYVLPEHPLPVKPEEVETAEAPIPVPTTIQADTPTLPATPAISTEEVPAASPALPEAHPITVQPPVQSAPKSAAPFPPLQHQVLVLTDEPKQRDMLMSEAIFLDNILKAVGHSLETSDVLNFSFLPGQDARTVLSGKKTGYFISFGVPLVKLHLDLLLVPYTPKIVEGIRFLLVDPLVVIEADRNLKKKLWQALQNMFGIS